MEIAWLIYCNVDIKKNTRSIEMFIDNFLKFGISLQLIVADKLNIVDENTSIRAYYEGKACDIPRIIVNRSRDYELSCTLEKAGCDVFNNRNITKLGNNKLYATRFVEHLGLPVLKTSEKYDDFDYPFVAKTKNGHGGAEVFKICNKCEREELVQRYRDNLLFQEFSSEGNSDVRVYVIGGQIYCAMLRTSDNDFRSNFSLGGNAEEMVIDDSLKTQTETIISSIGEIGYCGIDFIKHNGEWVFNEIEDVVGAKMLYTYTNYNPIKEYVLYICGK